MSQLPLPAALPSPQPSGGRALPDDPLVAVVSGKGGVGKTNLVANLAVAAAGQGARVLVVDGDLGLANLDVLLGLTPTRSIADVLDGRCELGEILIEGPRGVHLIPAAAGRCDLPALRPRQLAPLLAPLWRLARRYDLALVDAGAGVGPAVVALAASCRRALLLTTPEPTSFADAYATLKVLHQQAPSLPVELIVNAARDELSARDTHERLERVAHRFLGVAVGYRGFLPRDPRLAEAVARQRAVVQAYPTAASSRRIVALATGLLRELRPRESTP